MGVAIDEPGQHRHVRQIDDLGARRESHSPVPTASIFVPRIRIIDAVSARPGTTSMRRPARMAIAAGGALRGDARRSGARQIRGRRASGPGRGR